MPAWCPRRRRTAPPRRGDQGAGAPEPSRPGHRVRDPAASWRPRPWSAAAGCSSSTRPWTSARRRSTCANGWQDLGVVPDFAVGTDGELVGTRFMWKRLGPMSAAGAGGARFVQGVADLGAGGAGARRWLVTRPTGRRGRAGAAGRRRRGHARCRQRGRRLDRLPAAARDPLMRPLDGRFLRQGSRAVVELAVASGLSRVAAGRARRHRGHDLRHGPDPGRRDRARLPRHRAGAGWLGHHRWRGRTAGRTGCPAVRCHRQRPADGRRRARRPGPRRPVEGCRRCWPRST